MHWRSCYRAHGDGTHSYQQVLACWSMCFNHWMSILFGWRYRYCHGSIMFQRRRSIICGRSIIVGLVLEIGSTRLRIGFEVHSLTIFSTWSTLVVFVTKLMVPHCSRFIWLWDQHPCFCIIWLLVLGNQYASVDGVSEKSTLIDTVHMTKWIHIPWYI